MTDTIDNHIIQTGQVSLPTDVSETRVRRLEETIKSLYCQFAYRDGTEKNEPFSGGLASLEMAEQVIGREALLEYDRS